jgi:hypothetical protein
VKDKVDLHPDKPSRSEAQRRLVEMALKLKRNEKPRINLAPPAWQVHIASCPRQHGAGDAEIIALPGQAFVADCAVAESGLCGR